MPAPYNTFGLASWRYSQGAALPDVLGDQFTLIQDLDRMSGAGIGYQSTEALRAALVTNGQVFTGFVTYDAQDDVYYKWLGSAWGVFQAPKNSQRRAAAQSLTSTTTQTVLSWDTAVLPLSNLFTLSAGVFTATRACTVEVQASVDFAANGTGSRAASLTKNGTAIPAGGSNSVASNSSSIDTTIDFYATVSLAVGDTLAFQAAQTSGAALGVTGVITIAQIA